MANLVDLNREISTNNLRPYYILTGEEIGLMNFYISQVKGTVKREDSIATVWKNLTQKGILSVTSTYVVRDDDEFLKNDKVNGLLDTIKYGTLFLLITDKNKYKKFLNKYKDNVILFDKMTKEQLMQYFSNRYKQFDKALVDRVVEICEHDFSQINNELDKLSRLNSNVNLDEAVDKIIFHKTEFEVFKAIDYVLSYKPKLALEQLDVMFHNNESAMGFLTLLYNNFVSAVKVLGTNNPKPDTIHVNQFIINKINYDFDFSYNSARKGMKIIGDVIEGIKQGKYEERFGTYYCLLTIFSLD
nr:MAG TPA: DNA polymerase III, delta subunit [Caudoviricetes sp.]